MDIPRIAPYFATSLLDLVADGDDGGKRLHGESPGVAGMARRRVGSNLAMVG
ncbi:MAG: hypothetical protein WCZ86_12505 [Desulfurivibrionaceae bacterium]